MIKSLIALKNCCFSFVFLCTCTSAYAGLNNFSPLIYIDEWLIERKVDLDEDEVQCRASIPANATWFGARIRLGSENEFIKPLWIKLKEDELLDLKISKVKEVLDDCRSGLLFLSDY